MKSDEIDALCKKITRTVSQDHIDELLDKLSKDDLYDLYDLANKLLESPFQFDYALASVLSRLFDDTLEFAELLYKFFKTTSPNGICGTLYKPLKEKIIDKQNEGSAT